MQNLDSVLGICIALKVTDNKISSIKINSSRRMIIAIKINIITHEAKQLTRQLC